VGRDNHSPGHATTVAGRSRCCTDLLRTSSQFETAERPIAKWRVPICRAPSATYLRFRPRAFADVDLGLGSETMGLDRTSPTARRPGNRSSLRVSSVRQKPTVREPRVLLWFPATRTSIPTSGWTSTARRQPFAGLFYSGKLQQSASNSALPRQRTSASNRFLGGVTPFDQLLSRSDLQLRLPFAPFSTPVPAFRSSCSLSPSGRLPISPT